MAIVPEKSAPKSLNGWYCALDPDRPTYDCPECRKLAVQFYARLDSQPGREEFYCCCACGRFWEM